MGVFVAGLRARAAQAREAVRRAADAGDDYGVQVHAADLADLRRLAAEHGIDLTEAVGITTPGAAAVAADGETAR